MAFPDVTTTFEDGIRTGGYPQYIYQGGGSSANWDSVPIITGSTIWQVISAGLIANSTGGAEAVSAAQFGPDSCFTFLFPSGATFNASNYFAAWISSTGNSGSNSFPVAAINGYALIAGIGGTDEVTLRSYPGGTVLGSSVTQAIGAGDQLGIRQIGNVISIWYKAAAGSWTTLISVVDSTYSRAGRLCIEGTGCQIGNISGGTISSVDTRTGTSATGGRGLALSIGVKRALAASLVKARSSQNAVAIKSSASSSLAKGRSGQTSIDTKIASGSSLSSARGIVVSVGSQPGVDSRSGSSLTFSRGVINSTGTKIASTTSLIKARTVATAVSLKSVSGNSTASCRTIATGSGTRGAVASSSVRARTVATGAGFKLSSAFSSVRALSVGAAQATKFSGAISTVRARGVVLSTRLGEINTPYSTPTTTPGSPRLDQVTAYASPPTIGRVT